MTSRTEPYPLYNTSWTLYRASPLHHDSSGGRGLLHHPASLKSYSNQLRTWLRGDDFALGGPGASDDLLNTGPLKDCVLSRLLNEHLWSNEAELDPEAYSEADTAGLLVTLSYDKATYKAILLRTKEEGSGIEDSNFTKLPLLLLRMPVSLRQMVLEFFSKTFDTNILPLSLPSNDISRLLERYLASLWDQAPLNTALIRSIRDLVLTFGVAQPIAPALRTMDARLESNTVIQFLERAGVPSQDALPFLSALGGYLRAQTGLKLSDAFTATKGQSDAPARLSKIACAAFVLSEDGRLKLVDPKTIAGGSDDGMKEDIVEAIRKADGEVVAALIREALPGS